MTANRFDVARVLRKAAGVFLISSGAALAQNADSAAVVSPQLALAGPQSGAATAPIPDCPQIPKVCALIADPAIRNYIGPAEYAWDFNATASAPGPTPQSDRRVAGLGRN